MSIAAATTRVRWRNQSALPGFGLTFGFTFFYLSLIVLIPIAALVIRPWEIGLLEIADFEALIDAAEEMIAGG